MFKISYLVVNRNLKNANERISFKEGVSFTDTEQRVFIAFCNTVGVSITFFAGAVCTSAVPGHNCVFFTGYFLVGVTVEKQKRLGFILYFDETTKRMYYFENRDFGELKFFGEL